MSAFFGGASGFLNWLGYASVQGGILIGLILLVQALLQNRLSPGWRYAMWLLLVVRLVLPWAPQSSFSAHRLVSSAQPLLVAYQNPMSPTGMNDWSDAGHYQGLVEEQKAGNLSAAVSDQELSSERPRPTGSKGELAQSGKGVMEGRAVVGSERALGPDGISGPVASLKKAISSIPVSTFLPVVWLMGVLVLGASALMQSIRLMRAVGRRRFLTDQATLDLLENCKEEIGIHAYLAVVETNRVGSPALFGFVRPRLLLPAGTLATLGPEQLRHVFLHELAHLKRGDVAVNWLITLLQVLHWFNPLVWYAFSRMREERELACDALVLSHTQPNESTEYGRTIVYLLEQFTRARRLPSLAGVLEDKNLMKRRITMIRQFSSTNSYRWSALSVLVVILLGCVGLTNAPVGKQQFTEAAVKSAPSSLGEKVSQLKFQTSTREDVIRILGEPIKYLWGDQTFTVDSLPSMYTMLYPNQSQVVMANGRVDEIRFERPGYQFQNKIQVGSTLEEVLQVIGKPTETIDGRNDLKADVLYKDIDGHEGHCYYLRSDLGVRFFFADYKVSALYLIPKSQGGASSDGQAAPQESFQTVRPVLQINEYDDARWKDLSKVDFTTKMGVIPTLTFNEKTVWPAVVRNAVKDNPEQIAKASLNPGLGVRDLHRQGITGKGVNVAIIDQPMYDDHPEFAGKIAAYFDSGCGGEKSSMHGPAVASLLVGTNCGTAPDARLYFAAAPSWNGDSAYYAKSLDWILEQNAKLPEGEKIRVVSVSAAPSGPGSPFTKNHAMWDEACARAETEGIIVLDCSRTRGFIGPCWYDAANPDDVAKCTPGFPGSDFVAAPAMVSKNIFLPASPRTTAEERDKGQCSYQYCGRGGLSWSIPYAAGVLAMGWQVRPELSAQEMRELLFKSAYTREDGAKIINPKAFISAVKETSLASVQK